MMLDTDIVQMKHRHKYHTGSNLISCSKVLQAMYKHPQALALHKAATQSAFLRCCRYKQR